MTKDYESIEFFITKMLRMTIQILMDPLASFRSLKSQKYHDTLLHILIFGWVTAILSGILRIYGVNYNNPSNAGGSAQIFAAWAMEFTKYNSPLLEVILFSLLVMIGYLVLAIVSAPVLAIAVWLFTGRVWYDDYTRLSFIAVTYGMTPGFIFGWMPNPFYFVGLWATFWQVLAVRELLGLSWKKTLIVIISWILFMAIIHDLAGFVFKKIISSTVQI
jgi:hypothetical protein